MAENPISQLTFAELHLFPRAVFALGVFLIVWGVTKEHPEESILGLALFFGAIGVNILYDLRRSRGDEETGRKTQRRWLWAFCFFSLGIGALALAGLIQMFRTR